jgi:hypothetical protein
MASMSASAFAQGQSLVNRFGGREERLGGLAALPNMETLKPLQNDPRPLAQPSSITKGLNARCIHALNDRRDACEQRKRLQTWSHSNA